MPEIESFGSSERELKRRLAEIEQQVQTETKPLGDISRAIVQACMNCRDATKPLIQSPTEKDGMQCEMYIFCEFTYFFIHMTMRLATETLTTSQAQKLKGFLVPHFASVAIDSHFAPRPGFEPSADEYRQKLIANFCQRFSEQDAEYLKCARSVTNAMRFGLRPESSDPIVEVLFTTLAFNVTNWAIDSNIYYDHFQGVMLSKQESDAVNLVRQITTNEWSRTHMDRLIANASKGNWMDLI